MITTHFYPLILCSAFTVLSLTSEQVKAQTNHVLTTATTPRSSQAQISELQRIVSDQLGVAGKDPVGHKIGPNVAKRTGLGLNWYPIDIYKQTLCGTLHHFDFYDGLGDEADWNNYIIPGPKHAFLLEDAKPIADPDELHNCVGRGDCMEAEITPDETFYENPWFTKSVGNTGKSVLEGEQLCTYGPWVWEEAHGNRPEIHPSELYWWKETVSPSETLYFLMLLQDDSNRFDRSGDYNGSIARPWSKVPRTGEFRIAFQVNTLLERLTFDIDELDKRHVVTSLDPVARRDADDGKDHALQFDGKIVVRVNELQPADDDIGVRFVEVTRRGFGELPATLQGYIAITSKVGKSDRGEEGYHVLRVRARTSSSQQPVKPSAPVAPTIQASKPVMLAKPLRPSLRFAVVDGEPRLIGDIEMKTANGQVLGRANNVTALRGGAVELQTQSGSVMKVVLPEVVLAPLVSGSKPLLLKDTQTAWGEFVKAAGGPAVTDVVPAPLKLKLSQQLRIDAAPFYAPVRNGKPSREDDSPFSEELNETLKKGDAARTKRVFGSNQTVKEVNWSFAAKNLVSDEVVAVRIGSATNTEIVVEFLPGKTPKGSIRITFPTQPTNGIYEVVATVEMVDTFGHKGTNKQTVWSHSLSADDKTKLVAGVVDGAARIAGMDAKKVLARSKLDNLPQDDTTVRDPFSRCARMLRLAAMRAAEDGTVSVGELNQLKTIAELCKTR